MGVFSLEIRTLGGGADLIGADQCLKGGCQQGGTSLCSVVPGDRTRGKLEEVPSNHEEELLLFRCDRALKQLAQRGGRFQTHLDVFLVTLSR